MLTPSNRPNEGTKEDQSMGGLLYSSERLRRMYAGGRADPTARRLSHFWAAAFRLGLLPRRWVTVEVAGRSSGRPVRFPLGMANSGGDWYLVSMLGENCNWVRNVRAAGGQAVLRRRSAVRCQLVEVPAAERAPILKRYVEQVPGGRPHIPVTNAMLMVGLSVLLLVFGWRARRGGTEEPRV
jgi:deazaflavin-dependent oxidoreductase (nitroreductase family)